VSLPPITQLRELRRDVQENLLHFKFGMDEVLTKINILREEFAHVHEYNPIESVSSRLKTPASIVEKIVRKGCSYTPEDLAVHVRDIAGIRITCSFVQDIYKIKELLLGQKDITLVDERDYVKYPKENGYSSLHLIVTVPVFLSSGHKDVMVEVQIRTIAMDFWASLEHKIHYKYQGAVPEQLESELKLAAEIATRLDYKMQSLHEQVQAMAEDEPSNSETTVLDALDKLVLMALQNKRNDEASSLKMAQESKEEAEAPARP
jgi:putative GTP pyrophosphokinase